MLAARKSGYCPLIIDQCLLLWLGAFRALERTKALFGAGLAGGNLNPYTPEIAGSVPPEMFYGRTKDIENLGRQDGPCIIFGGRQLGKSALLLQVIRQHHNPQEERYVLYAGLKHGANILETIRKLLVESGLLKASVPRERTYAAIKELLAEQKNRRFIFLLDECDAFLEEDSRHRFEQTNQVRDLMAETGRRFKVVLTGLHNVQRFQRIPNQPLAHFGEPICIGPLDPASAAQLIQRPLEALGYRFEPANLVQRILASTNYHPSLIQLVCHDIVEHMLTSGRFGPATPPFIIDEEVIATVYRKAGLAERMRARFDWTLDLDQRYRVIGYTFAWLEANEPPTAEPSGRPVADILDHVQLYWPNGFGTTTVDELTGLLDEMVGLGVLTRGAGKRYRLRTPNVLRLLGDEYEILAELERFKTMPFTTPASPHVVRRVLDENAQSPATSPLTLAQEGDLLTAGRMLNLVVGTPATGIERVVPVTRSLFGEHTSIGAVGTELLSLEGLSDPSAAVNALRKLVKKFPASSLRVILVPGATPEGLGTVLLALAKYLAGLSTEHRFLSLVCPLGPAEVRELRLGDGYAALSDMEVVKIQTLGRWTEAGQRQWFYDIGRLPAQKEQPREWLKITGGWPVLLDPVHETFFRQPAQVAPVQFDPAVFLEKTGLLQNPPLEALFEILCHLNEEVDLSDLQGLAADDGITAERVLPLVHLLFDYGLVTGNPERLCVEPVAAQFFQAH